MTTETFVVVLVHAEGDEGFQWRGRVEHVRTGDRKTFFTQSELLEFLREHAGDRGLSG